MDTCLWTNKDLKVHLKLSVKLGPGAEPPCNNVAVLSGEGDGEEARRAHRPLPVCLLASKVIPEYMSVNWVGRLWKYNIDQEALGSSPK